MKFRKGIVKAIITNQELCTLKAIVFCVIVFNHDFQFNMDIHCSYDCLVYKANITIFPYVLSLLF